MLTSIKKDPVEATKAELLERIRHDSRRELVDPGAGP